MIDKIYCNLKNHNNPIRLKTKPLEAKTSHHKICPISLVYDCQTPNSPPPTLPISCYPAKSPCQKTAQQVKWRSDKCDNTDGHDDFLFCDKFNLS